MTLQSAASIESLINGALAKKPKLPKGLADDIKADNERRELRKAARKATATTAAAPAKLATKKKPAPPAQASASGKKKEKAAKAAPVERRAGRDVVPQRRVFGRKRVKMAAKAALEAKRAARKATRGATTKRPARPTRAAVPAEMSSDEEEAEESDASDADDGEAAIVRSVCGPSGGREALAEDPLLATFGGLGSDLVHDLAQEKAAEYVSQGQLLDNAHQFFTRLNKEEKRRMASATAQIREMRRINTMGGDKEGFKYVIPKSARSWAKTLDDGGSGIGLVERGVDPDALESHFLGTGEAGAKPMRHRQREREYRHDDFYQHQIAKKWTKNAENFLRRGRATKNMFMAKQQKLRTTKRM